MKIKVEVKAYNGSYVFPDTTAIIAGLQFLTIEYRTPIIEKGSIMFDFNLLESCKIDIQKEEE